MTTHIKVYPAKASALNVHHPIGGKPHVDGVDWPYDVFTCRRLTDGSFTEDATKAYKPPAAEAVVAEKPVVSMPEAVATAAASKPQEAAADAAKPK